MSRRCSICFHDKRRVIDAELLSGRWTYALLSKEYSLSHTALARHKRLHVSDKLLKAAEANKELSITLDSEGLARELLALKDRADSLGKQAEASSDIRTALLAVRELTRLVELQARLAIEAQTSAANVSVHPAWVRLRGALLLALSKHPSAHADVCAAMASVLGEVPSPGGMSILT